MTTNSHETTLETRVCIAQRSGNGWAYWSDYEFDPDAECADDYSGLSPSQLVETFIEIAEEADVPHSSLHIVTVDWVIKTTESITVDDDRIIEARRLKALAKLTPADIEVLGVGGLATYSKLKFHNAPEEELLKKD